MASITKSIFIAAPVEKVFAFMDDPMNTVDIMVGMANVRNVKDVGGSKSFDWTYKMGGMKFDGSSETIERTPNKSLTVAGKSVILFSAFKLSLMRRARSNRKIILATLVALMVVAGLCLLTLPLALVLRPMQAAQ